MHQLVNKVVIQCKDAMARQPAFADLSHLCSYGSLYLPLQS